MYDNIWNDIAIDSASNELLLTLENNRFSNRIKSKQDQNQNNNTQKALIVNDIASINAQFISVVMVLWFSIFLHLADRLGVKL